MSSKASGLLRLALATAVIVVVAAVIIAAATPDSQVADVPRLRPADADSRRVLIIYSGESNAALARLDMIAGQFADHVRRVAAADVHAADVAGSTHLVYLGGQTETLPPHLAGLLADGRMPLLAIGANVEQLGPRFAFVRPRGSAVIDTVALPGGEIEMDTPILIRTIDLAAGVTVAEAHADDAAHPLYVRLGNTHYLATGVSGVGAEHALTAGLMTLFGDNPGSVHPAHIRLEDIHPAADPALVRAAGTYLADRGIPFALVVIPVYVDPHSGRHIQLADRPELVRVLRYLQRRGGTVIQHGYTHQYHADETGEGFEFWDVENDHPIYAPAEADFTLRRRADFPSDAAYAAYWDELRAFERAYTLERILQGREALVALGLTPVAFEPPHYTMSQAGYDVLAGEYDLILGQLQLGDDTWLEMGSTPYMSRPSFLSGMMLLPETLSYFDPTEPDPLLVPRQLIAEMRTIPGATLGVFYHPYLGLEPLKELVAEIEAVPNVVWTDVADIAAAVRAGAVPDGVAMSAPAQMWLNARLLWGQWMMTRPFDTLTERILWSLSIVTMASALLFTRHAVFNHVRLRRRLFEERSL